MKKTLLLIFIAVTSTFTAQIANPRFQECLKQSPDNPTTFCLLDDVGLVDFLLKENVKIKYRTDKWLFVTTTPSWINTNQLNGNVKKFYFENSHPEILNDTTRLLRFVDPVHAGSGGLTQPYTGANVVMGYIDTGLDFTHPDFIDANGNTRVMRLWDQAVAGGANTYAEYGYGVLWDSTDINSGTCTHVATVNHGTAVVGIGSGNGLANGTNKGMAPDSKIVFVHTNLNATNWGGTVVDACDYIFKYADSLGLPAVINLSAGDYAGSHDGNDPNSQALEAMLDAKGGRLFVGAAGNSGSYTYHVDGVATVDTSFVWFKNNSTSVPGTNYAVVEVWADVSQANFQFAIGADKPAPSYGFRGRTIFRNAQANLNTVIYDTIWNGANRIASMQIWTEIIDGAYFMQVYIDKVDSTAYKFRFMTKGAGDYDLWGGQFRGYSDLETVIPTSALVQDIADYLMPNKSQQIVSSFQCSEKVITVGNSRNRQFFTNLNGTAGVVGANVPENISTNSSQGPSRVGVTKPDISANGEVVFTAAMMSYLANPAYYQFMTDAYHRIQNGTSMASPCVAGIAALYFEKCGRATYQDFKNDLIATSTSDIYTGVVPNNTYGYGKPHALNLLLGAANVPVLTPPVISYSAPLLSSDAQTNYQWVLNGENISGQTSQTYTPSPLDGNYSLTTYGAKGCPVSSNVINPAAAGLFEEQILGKLSPNPTNSEFKITVNDEIISVFASDVNGKEVDLINKGEGIYSVSHLKTGPYYLRVLTNKGLFRTKIVKL
jgi:hypothetical protein